MQEFDSSINLMEITKVLLIIFYNRKEEKMNSLFLTLEWSYLGYIERQPIC